jgi:hypothetical protein
MTVGVRAWWKEHEENDNKRINELKEKIQKIDNERAKLLAELNEEDAVDAWEYDPMGG